MITVSYLSTAAAVALLLPFAQANAQVDVPIDAYVTVPNWPVPPESRELGSVSSADLDAAGNLWITERCGQNSCVGRDDLSPILLFTAEGSLRRGFGAGMFVWPHGIHLDEDGNIWVTDGRAEGAQGLQVFKFSAAGELLLTLGEAGVSGTGANFSGPTDVLVAPNGDIFVTDGHEPDSNNRVVRFAADGTYLSSFGRTGSRPGEFLVPHAIAMDSKGRLFVADRDNNRLQIFDQDGTFLEEWLQFGRPSGIHIAADDRLYVSDNQSNDERNPGWPRGIYIGSAADGKVDAFIPDPEFDPGKSQESSAHGLVADATGTIYGAEVWAQTVKKYVVR